MPNGEKETLAIPAHVRAQVDERDQGICRMCGRYVGEARALHHIEYGGDKQGIGGRRRHVPENLLTVGWLFQHDCHSIIHGNKRLWTPLALVAAQDTGVTMLQLYRWNRRAR